MKQHHKTFHYHVADFETITQNNLIIGFFSTAHMFRFGMVSFQGETPMDFIEDDEMKTAFDEISHTVQIGIN